MASAQVLPNSAVSSRKHEHLEAGKRRLEEFRKKKAADRAKRAASAGQPAATVRIENDKQVLENGEFRAFDSEGAGISARPTDQQYKRVDNYGSMYPRNSHFGQQKEEKIGDHATSYNERRSANVASPDQLNNNESVQHSISLLQSSLELGQSVNGNSNFSTPLVTEWKEKNAGYEVNNFPSFLSADTEASQASTKTFIFDDKYSTSQVPFESVINDAYSRRSRPSFLDSLNIPRASPSTSFLNSQPQLVEVPNNIATSDSQERFGKNGNLQPHVENTNFHGNNINRHHAEKNEDLLQQKPNEDFAALEQHIEDLTQEKFSLQRALESSKTLAESLAAENSSLTESFNQQGGAVAQLKSEMERLESEINTLLAELESVRIQYANAQLECNAADEHAKLLASEVIVLEEKALKLRSNELKVEKELEKSNAEIASSKKKMSSLEKERQDLHMTIDALQEEKKLLQSKVRKAAAIGQSFDNKEKLCKKNESTSTEDLDVVQGGDLEMPATSNSEALDPSTGVNNLPIVGQNEASAFDASAIIIPSDQVQMIQNINALLSELMAEKEDLSQALVAEISRSSKLKDLNKELSQKLEVQTQRFELLTAQSIANESSTARQTGSSQIVQESVVYPDEGDEVVDRVLGWIMKIFPGGPSRRRTSKLL